MRDTTGSETGEPTADCPAPGVVRDLLRSDFERVARDGYIAVVAGQSVRVYRERAISHGDDAVRVTGELAWRPPTPAPRGACAGVCGWGKAARSRAPPPRAPRLGRAHRLGRTHRPIPCYDSSSGRPSSSVGGAR
jgi:hypothetical protein